MTSNSPSSSRSQDSAKTTVRVGSVQYPQRAIASFDEFQKSVEHYVEVVASYGGDFVVFPELFTLQLLSIEKEKLSPPSALEKLTSYTPTLKELFSNLSRKHNIHIIAGSHPTKSNDQVLNICYAFLRDGSVHEQAKIHPTPSERQCWKIEGGHDAPVIETDCGPIGILICYDSEFPELARHLVDQGAQILFVPFCTDEKQGYLRVRYCSQARAIENQCYMVLSGNVGNLTGVENMDIQYAQSCILTPCDFPFARDGIAAEATANVETIVFADLHRESLLESREHGTVQNLNDRRKDLYQVQWKSKN